MQTRSLLLALIAALLLTVGALAAACGGKDSLTLEEYFQQLDALHDTADERSEELSEAFDVELAAAASEEDALAVLEDFLKSTRPLSSTFVDGLSDLNPPAAVEELHNEYVDGSAELVASIEEVIDRFDDLDGVADLDGLFEESGFIQAGERLDETCAALQDIADKNEIDIDLDCED